ncbi:hypothetical protein GUJ93_ZPchr0002g24436 [Zizania palustris]|uniref:Uncharacterized protein n=1 Tax=Zizania palustris TaxID=103762 RepID=A0A8J5VHB4_ZIZPA|nr:hypothetical protein GUJ93_ZPchr0002g24436 [Zizania palustris]
MKMNIGYCVARSATALDALSTKDSLQQRLVQALRWSVKYKLAGKSKLGPSSSDVRHHYHKHGHWKRNCKVYLEEQKNKKGSVTSISGAE